MDYPSTHPLIWINDPLVFVFVGSRVEYDPQEKRLPVSEHAQRRCAIVVTASTDVTDELRAKQSANCRQLWTPTDRVANCGHPLIVSPIVDTH
jgi:hypothetical protein